MRWEVEQENARGTMRVDGSSGRCGYMLAAVPRGVHNTTMRLAAEQHFFVGLSLRPGTNSRIPPAICGILSR
ncbi:hypothetical protein DAI22_01g370400 [Oryza sativa Japonica Group]|jgi:hypothetical protein|nr:hypothetical protein DAI22_01g370400 [Oryza sativa Japonica Group]